ncbi:DUF2484 family protein [Paracoccus sp. S-4012]|uniref:DUF2484 family protein n=1 Tax=Paracoccus sp. S-4012 TaxID=2665648 RepID=UPI0012B023F6|nr:DUF2484 family protein [Paracoccus sp. S-4012]MRX51374.1 DUF2484 family protein [Paracoccus sp. S-4012]
MTGTPALLCFLCAAIWVGLTAAVGLVPAERRAGPFWAAALAGVPLLGWMTYVWGPGAGIATFLLGLLVLIRAPAAVGARRRRREAVVARRCAPAERKI